MKVETDFDGDGDDRRDYLMEKEFMGEDPADFPTLKELGLGRSFKDKLSAWADIAGGVLTGGFIGSMVSSLGVMTVGIEGGSVFAKVIVGGSAIGMAIYFAKLSRR